MNNMNEQQYSEDNVQDVVIGDCKLMFGDCLVRMKEIPDGSVDMILCDLPYGTTAATWDSIISFSDLWLEYKRVIKSNGAVVLTSLQPFTTKLINSNPSMFKYAYVWIKSRALGFQNAKLRPMTRHEDVLVFSQGNAANRASNLMVYNPQGLTRVDKKVNGLKASKDDSTGHRMGRPSHKAERVQDFTGYPDTVLNFANEGSAVHPTQKPVTLFEHLIRTYTDSGNVVLDNCMGSGTTGVACANSSRNFIGIESYSKYFDIASKRIAEAHNKSKSQ
jgi:site-specific DNA-methyltransferase (adenine-specific)